MTERSTVCRSQQRTEERPPYVRLEFANIGAHRGTKAVRQSLLEPSPQTQNREAKYKFYIAKWDSTKQQFSPVCFGRSSTNTFVMRDDQASRVQASFQLEFGEGGKLEIYFKNMGSRELHHLRDNVAKTLASSDSVVLENGDLIDFHTSEYPLRMKCDVKTETKEDPLMTGFTVALEEVSRSVASGHDVPERVPMQPRD